MKIWLRDRCWEVIKGVSVVCFILYMSILYPLFLSDTAVNCQAINENRIQLNDRANAARGFYQTLSDRVSERAVREFKAGQTVAAEADVKSARLYLTFKSGYASIALVSC